MIHAHFVAYTLANAAACLSPSTVAADLPKSGTYSAHYGWTFSGEVRALGADRTVYAGVVAGVIFNDAGKGFLHKARVDCPIYNDVNQGHANAKGSCVVMDVDGDKIFMERQCTGAMPACPGDERFVGGTGKYIGAAAAVSSRVTSSAIPEGWSD